MLRRIRRLPSPALVISAIALVFAVGGGTFALAISKSKTKTIAKKVANKQINKKAPDLKVKHAKKASNADHATNADFATNAGNANTVGGQPPTAFLGSGAVRADGAGTSTTINDFTTPTFTALVSKTFTVPSNGFIYLTGSISTEDDVTLPGDGELLFRLVVDGAALTSGNDFAHSISTSVANGVEDASGSTTAVVAVTAGTHTVDLQAREGATGDFIEGREISALFVPNGSAQAVPFHAGGSKANK
jgi:hypothetical protein